MASKVRYAKGPVIYLYDRGDLKTKRKQLLWGDWLRVGADIDSKFSEIDWGKKKFAIKKEDYQEERLLEMIFVDVGQGDGCILTLPEVGRKEKVMIVDAGKSDNMDRYLNYRFRDFKKKFKFHAAIITHPDSDHYRGFQATFDNPQVSFDHVYHNGLMERTGSKLLGPLQDGYFTDLRETAASARTLYRKKSVRGSKWYPELIWTALQSSRFGGVSMLSTATAQVEDNRAWMPGLAPSNNPELTVEVLGPIVEVVKRRKSLRAFGQKLTSKSADNGKTKNGHSILLRLQYRDFSVLFGGDLNLPAETFLMRHYGNDGAAPKTQAEIDSMVQNARKRFAVDLMKTCHHGSSDVTDEFLHATAPAAYVVSSGDEESHVHPRPDLLGLLGKKGRGNRPLLLSTEMLRSSRENESPKLRKKLDRLEAKINKEIDTTKLAGLRTEREELLDTIFKRNIGVYGAINLRTDGNTAIIAFRKEKPKGLSRWFYYELEKDRDGIFQVQLQDGH